MNNHFMKNPITRSLALFLSFVALANAETSNPLYPRPSGGAGAEGLKKGILINSLVPLAVSAICREDRPQSG
jgi:hypothetical protein